MTIRCVPCLICGMNDHVSASCLSPAAEVLPKLRAVPVEGSTEARARSQRSSAIAERELLVALRHPN